MASDSQLPLNPALINVSQLYRRQQDREGATGSPASHLTAQGTAEALTAHQAKPLLISNRSQEQTPAPGTDTLKWLSWYHPWHNQEGSDSSARSENAFWGQAPIRTGHPSQVRTNTNP